MPESLMGRDHLEDLGMDRTISEWSFEKYGTKVWSAFIWQRKGTSGRLL
jgi:hypothetical protein